MTTLSTLKERYTDVRERIARAAERSGRSASDILLVAVTKHAEPEQIRELVQLGHVDFGENRVQHLVQVAAMIDEWLARRRTLPNASWPSPWPGGPDLWTAAERGSMAAGYQAPGARPPAAVRWHMIGHLQRNKARKVMEICRLIHSVDSLRLAEELQIAAGKKDLTVDVLLQVNTSGERSKFGCAAPAALHLAEQIDTMVQVRLRGLMTMAPLSDNPEDARDTFARCRDVFQDIRDAGIAAGHFNILSMGMSSDFEVAIEEGANLVRVGSAIFGESAHGPEEEPESEED